MRVVQANTCVPISPVSQSLPGATGLNDHSSDDARWFAGEMQSVAKIPDVRVVHIVQVNRGPDTFDLSNIPKVQLPGLMDRLR